MSSLCAGQQAALLGIEGLEKVEERPHRENLEPTEPPWGADIDHISHGPPEERSTKGRLEAHMVLIQIHGLTRHEVIRVHLTGAQVLDPYMGAEAGDRRADGGKIGRRGAREEQSEMAGSPSGKPLTWSWPNVEPESVTHGAGEVGSGGCPS